VQEFVLDNGLKVLTCEIHNAPIIFSQISYKVGSRNETYGKTGISHLVEHMMFKGTPKYPKGVISRRIKQAGGLFNAFTSKDMTAYFEQIPKNNLEIVLDIESERMMNCVFDENEFQLEREVVKEERRMRTDDSSIGIFREEMLATAFHAHPLRHPVIGWMDDLNAITRDQAFDYYKTYYTPNNATLVLVGDFETASVLKKVKKYFGRIPRGAKVPPVVSYFEEQKTRREFTLLRPDVRLATIELAFHVPGMGHPDEPALHIANNILGGGTFASFGKIILTEKKWGRNSAVRYFRGKDPELFRFSVDLFAENIGKLDSVVAIVFDCIEKLQQEPIPEAELQTVRNRIAYNEIFENQNVAQIGTNLSVYETYSSWKDAEKYQQALKKVTAQDVQRVLQTYFSREKVTIGRLIPREYRPDEKHIAPRVENGEYAAGKPPSTQFDFSEWEIQDLKKDILPPNPFAQRIQTARLKNGIQIFGIEDHTLPVFYVNGVIHTGVISEEDAFCGITTYMANVMNRGTTKRTYDELSRLREFYPISLDVSGGNGSITFGGSGLVETADSLLMLLHEIFRFPAFSEKSMEHTWKNSQAMLKTADAKAGWSTSSFVFETIYQNHPYSNLPDFKKFKLEQLSQAQLQQMHQKYVRPEQLKITVLGDLKFKEMVALIGQYFGEWQNPTEFQRQAFPDVPWYTGRTLKVFSMPEKSQVEIRMGASWVGRNDPRNDALELLNYILGGSSLTSRLGTSIRDEQGLAYQINSKIRQRANGGIWLLTSQSAPETAKQLIRSVLELIRKTREQGVSGRELQDAKVYYLQTLPMINESAGDLYQTFSELVREDSPLDNFDTRFNRILNISLEEVNRLAREILDEKNFVITAAGAIPEDFLDEFK
jgi:zinc protease